MAKAKKTETPNAEYKTVKLEEIISNPDNPRVISNEDFSNLVASIEELPKMLEIRPIVVNEAMMVVGGNQRLEAMRELGYKEATVFVAKGWTPEELEQYIIKDNTHFGSWAWSMLDSKDKDKLQAWGVDVDEWEESDFKPNFNPQTGNDSISPEDVAKTNSNLNANFTGAGNQEMTDIVCPHCLENFKVKL